MSRIPQSDEQPDFLEVDGPYFDDTYFEHYEELDFDADEFDPFDIDDPSIDEALAYAA